MASRHPCEPHSARHGSASLAYIVSRSHTDNGMAANSSPVSWLVTVHALPSVVSFGMALMYARPDTLASAKFTC